MPIATPEYVVRETGQTTPPPDGRRRPGSFAQALRDLKPGQELETTTSQVSVLASAKRVGVTVTTRKRDGKTFVYKLKDGRK